MRYIYEFKSSKRAEKGFILGSGPIKASLSEKWLVKHHLHEEQEIYSSEYPGLSNAPVQDLRVRSPGPPKQRPPARTREGL